MQRGIFRRDPEYGKEWVKEYGDQCSGISMAATKKGRNYKALGIRGKQ